MKIGKPLDNLVPTPPVAGPRGNAADASASATAAPASGGSSSTVALSSTATGLLAAGSGVAPAAGEFDAAKVERISNAIEDGSYTVDAEAIADKLLANAQELLSRPN